MKNLIYSLALCGTLFSACHEPKQAVTVQLHNNADWRSVASKPPMGWNSYDAYHGAITEKQFLSVVDVLADKMLPFGYEYAVVDFCWYQPGPEGWNPDKWESFEVMLPRDKNYKAISNLKMDGNGRLIPDVVRFPSAADGNGFKTISDYVHKKGMKFGIHIMRGIPREAVEQKMPILGTNYTAADVAEPLDTCRWLNHMFGVDASKPGAQEYYNSLFNMYAAWGVDFIKADDMMVPPYHKGEIEMMHKAIAQCGRPMVLSLSCGEAPLGMAIHLDSLANMYRISGDFWDRWDDVAHMFDLLNWWSPFIGNGSWPDADMLPLGNLCLTGYPGAKNNPKSGHREHACFLTPDEQQTLMTLWCMARSPLMWGGDPLTSDAATYRLITNKEVLDVNQNSSNNHQAYNSFYGRSDVRIWIADGSDRNTKYISFSNITDKPANGALTLEVEDIRGIWMLRDLWQHADLGSAEKEIKVTLKPHASVMYKLTKL